LPRDYSDAALTRGVVVKAHSSGITDILGRGQAGGQWKWPFGLGCEEMQGNYFSAPVTADLVPGIVRQPAAAGRRGEGGLKQ